MNESLLETSSVERVRAGMTVLDGTVGRLRARARVHMAEPDAAPATGAAATCRTDQSRCEPSSDASASSESRALSSTGPNARCSATAWPKSRARCGCSRLWLARLSRREARAGRALGSDASMVR